MTKTHQKSLDVIESIKRQGRGREVIVPKPEPPPSEVGSTMEQYPEQGYETMVVNGLIDPAKNWGVAVADQDYQESESLR